MKLTVSVRVVRDIKGHTTQILPAGLDVILLEPPFIEAAGIRWRVTPPEQLFPDYVDDSEMREHTFQTLAEDVIATVGDGQSVVTVQAGTEVIASETEPNYSFALMGEDGELIELRSHVPVTYRPEPDPNAPPTPRVAPEAPSEEPEVKTLSSDVFAAQLGSTYLETFPSGTPIVTKPGEPTHFFVLDENGLEIEYVSTTELKTS